MPVVPRMKALNSNSQRRILLTAAWCTNSSRRHRSHSMLRPNSRLAARAEVGPRLTHSSQELHWLPGFHPLGERPRHRQALVEQGEVQAPGQLMAAGRGPRRRGALST